MKKGKIPEFCYCEIPNEEDVLTILGTEGMKQYRAQKHFHNLLEIGICRAGHGEVMIDGRAYPYEAGCISVIPKNVPHAVRGKEGQESFWEYIYVNPAHFLEKKCAIEKRERKQCLELIEFHSFLKGRGEVPLLTAEINLLMDQIRTQGYGYRQCVRGLVYTLLMELAKINYGKELGIQKIVSAESETTQKIAKALDYIEEHYTEKIRVADIAKAAFVSPNYLRKLFLEYCQMSPMQYLNYARIRSACRIMRHTDDNVNEVSRKVGYENPATFINNFKLYTGETPKQWKEHR